MNEHALPVVDEALCTACGDCVETCPKDLFAIHSVDHQLWVACKNQAAGDELLAICEVACTACGRCALDSADQLISMENNLPHIDYQKSCDSKLPIQRCPTGAIVWINKDGTIEKGEMAAKVIRQSTLPLAPS